MELAEFGSHVKETNQVNAATIGSTTQKESNLIQESMTQELSCNNDKKQNIENNLNRNISSLDKSMLEKSIQEPAQPASNHSSISKRHVSTNGIPPLSERYELSQLQAQQNYKQAQQMQSKKSDGDYERVRYFEDFYPDDFEEVVYIDEED